jgi:hypothetical protein
MKTLKQIEKDYKSETLDGRDLNRLAQFIPENQLGKFGLQIVAGEEGKHKHIPFTREAVLAQLEKDVEFGFEKSLRKRSISSSLMFAVVKMWNWVLEEGLESWGDENSDYAMYGLPLFKATAVKYGWDNPIGEDSGREEKYDG